MTKIESAKLGLIALQSLWKHPEERPRALKLLSISAWMDAVRPGLPKSIRKSGRKAMIALLDKDAFGKEFEDKFKKGKKTILC
jgi:hypothetical protein